MATDSKKWYDDIDARWSRIGDLVELFGTEDDKIAWMLCRGDAAEWRMPQIMSNLKELKGRLPNNS